MVNFAPRLYPVRPRPSIKEFVVTLILNAHGATPPGLVEDGVVVDCLRQGG